MSWSSAGSPPRSRRKHFKAARDGFEAAVGALRPGARCSDVDAAVRAAFKQNGFPVAHYSGHQIGATVNEQPRVVPYDTTPVETGHGLLLRAGGRCRAGGYDGSPPGAHGRGDGFRQRDSESVSLGHGVAEEADGKEVEA